MWSLGNEGSPSLKKYKNPGGDCYWGRGATHSSIHGWYENNEFQKSSLFPVCSSPRKLHSHPTKRHTSLATKRVAEPPGEQNDIWEACQVSGIVLNDASAVNLHSYIYNVWTYICNITCRHKYDHMALNHYFRTQSLLAALVCSDHPYLLSTL